MPTNLLDNGRIFVAVAACVDCLLIIGFDRDIDFSAGFVKLSFRRTIIDSCDSVFSVFIELSIDSPNESIDRSMSCELLFFVNLLTLAGEAKLSLDMFVESLSLFAGCCFFIGGWCRFDGLALRELSLDE